MPRNLWRAPTVSGTTKSRMALTIFCVESNVLPGDVMSHEGYCIQTYFQFLRIELHYQLAAPFQQCLKMPVMLILVSAKHNQIICDNDDSL